MSFAKVSSLVLVLAFAPFACGPGDVACEGCVSDSECADGRPIPGDCVRWACTSESGIDVSHGGTIDGCRVVPLAVGSPCTNGAPECHGTCGDPNDPVCPGSCLPDPDAPRYCAPGCLSSR